MNKISRFAMTAMATLLVSAAGNARAQEVSGLNLTLKQTNIKAAMPVGTIGSTFTEMFTPTTVTCPNKGMCMVQIQISSIFQTLWPYDEVIVRVEVDGQLAGPNPYGSTVVRANGASTEDDNRQASSFTWAQIVKPGNHTVSVQVRANQQTVVMGERTLVVSLFN